jgi:hypothetical protein
MKFQDYSIIFFILTLEYFSKNFFYIRIKVVIRIKILTALNHSIY